ncbi:hypothetical protein JYG34_23170 [Pseudomonas entomophila]|uniref:hypothetical protein n=1 Tax=Pseudomonas entomophila TaxID=312306 RepID=UPI001BD1B452|nr:hypothetical protein [Pseudomonas entomophila]QVM90870.1 hypothetical protein JYG34_23170 [Pseudomonas entomophila]
MGEPMITGSPMVLRSLRYVREVGTILRDDLKQLQDVIDSVMPTEILTHCVATGNTAETEQITQLAMSEVIDIVGSVDDVLRCFVDFLLEIRCKSLLVHWFEPGT